MTFVNLDLAITMTALDEYFSEYKHLVGPDIDHAIDKKLAPSLGWTEAARNTTYEEAIDRLLSWHLDWPVIDAKIKKEGLPSIDLKPDDMFLSWIMYLFLDEGYFDEIYSELEYENNWEGLK